MCHIWALLTTHEEALYQVFVPLPLPFTGWRWRQLRRFRGKTVCGIKSRGILAGMKTHFTVMLLALPRVAKKESIFRYPLLWQRKIKHHLRYSSRIMFNKLYAWRHDMPRPSPPSVGAQALRAPPGRRNVSVLSHAKYVPTLTAAAALAVKAALSKAAWWPWPFDLESGVRVTCDVGYLFANFGLPRPLCSRLRPNVRDRQTDVRQTDVRQKHRLMPQPIRGGA